MKDENKEYTLGDTYFNPEETALVSFSFNGEVVGELWYKGKLLTFTGDTDQSAELFFDHVIKVAMTRIKGE